MEIHDQLARVVCLVDKKRKIASLSINQRVYKAIKNWAGSVGVGGGEAKWTHFIGIPLSVNNGVGRDNLCTLRFARGESLKVALDTAESFRYDVNEKETP